MTEGARERLEGEAIFFADRNTAFRSQDAAQQHATDLRELLARLSRYEAALRRIAEVGTRRVTKRVRGKNVSAEIRSPEARIALAALSDGETK